MDIYCKMWNDFFNNICSKNYDDAVALWEPDTRNIFRKNINNFRKRQRHWKKVEYVGTTEDGYIIVKYIRPKGLSAKSLLAFNHYRSGQKRNYGKFISFLYDVAKKYRNQGYGYFHSLCGVLLKHFDIAVREYRNTEVIKKYAIIQCGDMKYFGWSYSKSLIPSKTDYKYEYETFIFFSVTDYSPHLAMLKKLDTYIKSILNDIKRTIPKINIYFHAKINTVNTGIPKAIFVAPGCNNICIYSLRVQYDTLKHEMLHSIIYAATSSWPPLFFREGYAESYEKSNEACKVLLKNKFPVKFLLKDFLFFDYTENPPAIAGIFVRYLIAEYGAERFYSAYSKAERMSAKQALRKEYGLNIFQLRNIAAEFLQVSKL